MANKTGAVLLAGHIALETTAKLARANEETLRKRLPGYFVETAAELWCEREGGAARQSVAAQQTVAGQAKKISEKQTAQTASAEQVIAAQAAPMESLDCGWPAKSLANAGVAYTLDLTGCSILDALWHMAEAMDAGFEGDLRAILIRQETVEVCELLEVNPYESPSGGATLLCVELSQAAEVLALLQAAGIPTTQIGWLTDGNDRILHNKEQVRYLNKPRP